MKNFAIVGYKGYISPRHIDAISKIGGRIIAAYDIVEAEINDIERLPEAKFFSEYQDFLNFLDTNSGNMVEFISICSPNYLHFEHIRDSLNRGRTVICEKPIVGSIRELDELEKIETASGKNVFSILQLRYHNAVKELKHKVKSEGKKTHDVDLTYIAGRDAQYLNSWKGDSSKSFGIEANIGIHFFDMLGYVFGELEESIVTHREPIKSSGFMKFDLANVRWYLSIDASDIPNKNKSEASVYRSIKIDKKELNFSSMSGFLDLHTLSYQEIFSGSGFDIADVRPSIKILDKIRSDSVKDIDQNKLHPILKRL